MLPSPTVWASLWDCSDCCWACNVRVSLPRLPSAVRSEACACCRAEKACCAPAVVDRLWAPRLAAAVEKKLLDWTVSVEPSVLASTLSEVEPEESRLRPLKE